MYVPKTDTCQACDRARIHMEAVQEDDPKRAPILEQVEIIPLGGDIRCCKELGNVWHFLSAATDGTKFICNEMKRFCVKQNSDVVQFKSSNDPLATRHNLECTSKTSSIQDMPRINEEILISKEKMKDILSLLPYIPPIHHQFFLDLPHEQNSDD